MTIGQTIAITLGSVAVLAALAGGGYHLLRRHQAGQGARPGEVRPALPAPQPSGPVGSPGEPPRPDATPADVLAELQRQQAAEAERQRQADIRGFVDRIAAVENLQMLQLAEIDKVNTNSAPLEDFRQQYIGQAVNSPRYEALISQCKQKVWDNCPGNDWMKRIGSCDDDNYPVCEARRSVLNGYVRGDWNGNTDRNPWHLISDEAGPWADQRLQEWRAAQRRTFEARLAELEIQYRGMVNELKARFGVDYSPLAANAHAGHEYASRLLTGGAHAAQQPYAVA